MVLVEPKMRSSLKLDTLEFRVINACLEEIRHKVETADRRAPLSERISRLCSDTVQMTEVRGGLTGDMQAEADSLFRIFIDHPVPARRGRGPETGIAKEVRTILREHDLYGRRKLFKNYVIEQVKLDFGCRSDGGHIAIEAVDLTMPGREERLEKVGVAAGKFQFLHDKIRDVKRYVAVKTNGVDSTWELEHVRSSADGVFNIIHEVPAFIREISRSVAV